MLVCQCKFYLNFQNCFKLNLRVCDKNSAKKFYNGLSIRLDKIFFHSATDVKFCFLCQDLKYPRFNHCRYCNTCIYKLDHHCFFINNCVGQHNHKFFIQFLFYLWLPTLFSLILHLWSFLVDSSLSKGKEYSSPYLTPKPLRNLIICHWVFNSIIFLCTFGLFCFQMYLIKVNLTSIEFGNSIFRRNLPYERDWQEAFNGNSPNFQKYLEATIF